MNRAHSPRECSRLFHIKLQGDGTWKVESLCGYIARVACEHMVRPSVLLHRYLGWYHAGRPECVGQWKRYTGRLQITAAINAHTVGARWIELLEVLGCVSGLAEGTLAGWRNIFPTRRLVRKDHAWCMACYAEAKEPTDQLLWSLAAVRACPRHRCQLAHRCPSCGRSVPIINARSVPGFCPHCSSSLIGQAKDSQPADDYDCQLAQLAADFIRDTATQRRTGIMIERHDTADTIQACMRTAKISDAAELGRLVGVSRITAWYWIRGRAVPHFEHTLRLCGSLGISVAEFVAGRVPSALTPRGSGELPLRPGRRDRRPFNAVQVTKRIESYRAHRAANPPTLADVGREVGFEARTLRQHFPVLCREISDTRRCWFRTFLAARREERRQAFRIAIQTSRAIQKKPTLAQAMHLLPKPGVLRSAAARREFKQLLLEMR